MGIDTDANYGDSYSSSKLWSLYLTEADKYDKGLADTWKEDTNGILIFVRRPFIHREHLFIPLGRTSDWLVFRNSGRVHY